MPAAAATFLFVALIAWLLRRDARFHGPMAPGLLLPFIWIAINSSRPIVYWLASGEAAAGAGDVTDGNAIDRNVYLGLLAAGCVVLMRRNLDWTAVRLNLRWLLVLYVYYLLSTLWSEYPFVAFKRWVKDAGDIVMILIILSDQNPIQALRSVFVRCAYILVPVSVLFIKWLPALGRYTHRWTYETYYSGVTLNKNTLGLLATISGLFVLWEVIREWQSTGRISKLRRFWPEMLVLSMCVWLSHMARSSTASTCFAVGAAMMLLAQVKWGRQHFRRMALVGAAVGLFLLAFTFNEPFRALVATALGRRADLTERTAIWDNALALKTNPVVGSGFNSTWLTEAAAPFVEEYNLAHAHNGYLEAYLHTGWIGVALLALVLSQAGRNATRIFAHNYRIGCIMLALFWIGLLQNYTEVTYSRSNPMGMLHWLFAAFGTRVLVRSQILAYASAPLLRRPPAN